ncbi:MAG: TIGR03790 family protein [Verrucomicrobiales bacterium]|jgi:uncharacterized protein (TIGR03790 family)|nr:TIGR03790 family protein [Verrucomicrobiales bacterium]
MNRLPLLVAGWLLACVVMARADGGQELAKHTLVVYNSNDRDSLALAERYAALRQIPLERVLGISCPTDETVSRKIYTAQIEAPINDYCTRQGWFQRGVRQLTWFGREYTVNQTLNNPIWCVVLMRGVPLRVAGDAELPPVDHVPEAMRVNAAAVDSELARLPCQGLPAWGFVPNPYFSATLTRPFSALYADWLMLVARLDAPTVADARRMLEDSVSAERLELTGRAYFDSRGITDRGSGYFAADEAMRRAADRVTKAGLETSLDTLPDVAPVNTPWDNVALYFGWYTEHCAGPFLQPGFKFRPGAIAYHIHSFSAETLRSTTTHWAGPLLGKGAAATMGCVYEPYVSFTPNVEVFVSGLLGGLTFGEAAYQAQPVLSWMVTMVGDPLYRPFPRQLLRDVTAANDAGDRDLPWLLLRLARLIAAQNDKPVEERLRQLAALTERGGANGWFWEGYAGILQTLQQPPDTVSGAYQKALANPESPAAVIRVTLKLADYYLSQNRVADAFALYETLTVTHPREAEFYHVPQTAQAKAREHNWWDKLPPALQPPPLPSPNREQ